MENIPSAELLESTHTFPGAYRIKAIGEAGDDFRDAVIAAVLSELASELHLEHSARATPSGRHVSVTLDFQVESAEQVRAIYSKIHQVKGLTLIF